MAFLRGLNHRTNQPMMLTGALFVVTTNTVCLKKSYVKAAEEPLSRAVYVPFYSNKVKEKQETQFTDTYALMKAKNFHGSDKMKRTEDTHYQMISSRELLISLVVKVTLKKQMAHTYKLIESISGMDGRG